MGTTPSELSTRLIVLCFQSPKLSRFAARRCHRSREEELCDYSTFHIILFINNPTKPAPGTVFHHFPFLDGVTRTLVLCMKPTHLHSHSVWLCIQTCFSELSVRSIKGLNLDLVSIKRPLLARADTDEYDAFVFLPSAAGLITLPAQHQKSSLTPRPPSRSHRQWCMPQTLQLLMGIIKKKLSVMYERCRIDACVRGISPFCNSPLGNALKY